MSCHKCDKRHVGCHAECEDYQEYAAKRKAELEAKRKQDAVLDVLTQGLVKREKNARHISFKSVRRNRGT